MIRASLPNPLLRVLASASPSYRFRRSPFFRRLTAHTAPPSIRGHSRVGLSPPFLPPYVLEPVRS